MTTDTKLKELVINKLTTAQYDSIEEKDPNQVYIVTDAHGFEESITNCITKIPQDVKLELNNGTLTLKAGSKVYVPNGAGKFDEIVIANDLNVDVAQASDQFMIAYNKTIGNIWFVALSDQASGTTPTGNGFYYNTFTNKMLFLRSGVADNYEFSLPLGIVTSDSNKYTSINQVFNGFGYIGSTVFVLPGVKGLVPNGRNEDGSLRNIEVINNSVLINTFTESRDSWKMYLENTTPISLRLSSGITYLEDVNHNHYDSTNAYINVCYLGSVENVGSLNISKFTPKTTFHALDYNDKSTVASWSMPSDRYVDLTLGASGSSYTAPANGWFMIGKRIGGTSITYELSLQLLNKEREIILNDARLVTTGSLSVNHALYVWSPVRKGNTCKVQYNLTGETIFFRFVYAEGEQ